MTNEEYSSYLAAVTASTTGVQADLSTWSQDDPVRYLAILTFGAISGQKKHFGTPKDLEADLQKIEEQLKGNTTDE